MTVTLASIRQRFHRSAKLYGKNHTNVHVCKHRPPLAVLHVGTWISQKCGANRQTTHSVAVCVRHVITFLCRCTSVCDKVPIATHHSTGLMQKYKLGLRISCGFAYRQKDVYPRCSVCGCQQWAGEVLVNVLIQSVREHVQCGSKQTSMKQAVRTGYQIQRADFLSSLINFRYLFFGIFFSLHSLNASHPFCCPFYARKEVPLCIFFFCDRVINVLTFVPTAAHISILAVIRDAVARIFLLLNTSSEWSSSHCCCQYSPYLRYSKKTPT